MSFIFFTTTKTLKTLKIKLGYRFIRGAVHCGPYAKEKISMLFENESVESIVLAIFAANGEIGILGLGSFDRSKYLGDEDTTFIQYIRDVIEKRLVTIKSNG